VHVQKSLNSLKNQTYKNFQVFFVDYGSDVNIADQVRNLCESFPFIQYKYYPVKDQPWNKSKALNSVIKDLKEGYCFVADVDMIFHPEFIEKAIQLQKDQKTIYFQVGFLSPADKIEGKNFDEFSNFRKSTSEATGLSMFPVKAVKKLRGFDEFYHLWGAEDTDIHVRLRNAGFEVEYYDKEVLMLHQWHASFRSNETKNLAEDFQIEGIVQLNHQHLKFAEQNMVTKVNLNGWGCIYSMDEIEKLENVPVSIEITNEKRQVDDFLFGQLPQYKNEIVKVVIRRDYFHKSSKYKLKKIAGKKLPEYYSLKQVNDKVLLHLISFYRDKPYLYQIHDGSIIFAINIA
jgi:glycosyltransferase involved in cell wall biosynthesis